MGGWVMRLKRHIDDGLGDEKGRLCPPAQGRRPGECGFPIIMTALGLLTGMVQAYIFSILAAVYIAAATRVRKPTPAAEAVPSP